MCFTSDSATESILAVHVPYTSAYLCDMHYFTGRVKLLKLNGFASVLLLPVCNYGVCIWPLTLVQYEYKDGAMKFVNHLLYEKLLIL